MPRRKAVRGNARGRGSGRGDLRAEILETSLRLIAEKGVRALTLREIGRRLGVSRMAPYRHFADKAALLAELGAAGFEEFGNVLERAQESAPGSFLAQLDAMGTAYVRFAGEHRAHFDVMFGAGDDWMDMRVAQVAERAFSILEETIRAGQGTGEIREGDAGEMARMVWSLVHGISLLGFGRAGDFEQSCFRMLQTGIAKPGSEKRR